MLYKCFSLVDKAHVESETKPLQYEVTHTMGFVLLSEASKVACIVELDEHAIPIVRGVIEATKDHDQPTKDTSRLKSIGPRKRSWHPCGTECRS